MINDAKAKLLKFWNDKNLGKERYYVESKDEKTKIAKRLKGWQIKETKRVTNKND